MLMRDLLQDFRRWNGVDPPNVSKLALYLVTSMLHWTFFLDTKGQTQMKRLTCVTCGHGHWTPRAVLVYPASCNIAVMYEHCMRRTWKTSFPNNPPSIYQSLICIFEILFQNIHRRRLKEPSKWKTKVELLCRTGNSENRLPAVRKRIPCRDDDGKEKIGKTQSLTQISKSSQGPERAVWTWLKLLLL